MRLPLFYLKVIGVSITKRDLVKKGTLVHIIGVKCQKYTIILGVYADYFYICRQYRLKSGHFGVIARSYTVF